MHDPFHPGRVQDEFQLAQWCLRLWHHRRMVLLFGVAAALFTGLYLLACAKPYTAAALVRIEPGARAGREMQAITLESEMDFIRARSTFLDALNRLGPSVDVYHADSRLKATAREMLGMRRANVFRAEEQSFVIDRLEVPDRLLNQKLTLQIEEGGHYTLYDTQNSLIYSDVLADATAQAAERQQGAALPVTLVVREVTAAPGKRFTLIPRSRKNIVTQLQSQLGLETIGRKEHAGFIRLHFASENAEFAKRFLSALTESYVARAYEQRATGTQEAVNRLTAQLAAIKQELERAEAVRESFQREKGTVDMTAEMKLALEQLMEIEGQLRGITSKQKELGVYYTPQHPSYQAIASQLAFLQSEHTYAQQRIDRLPETQRQLLHITREVETFKQMYEQTAQKLTELRNEAASISGYATMIDPPEILPGSGLAHYLRSLLMGFLIGLMLGGVAVYVTAFSPLASVREARQVVALTQLPVLGRLRRMRASFAFWKSRATQRVMPLVFDAHRDTALLQDFTALMQNLSFASFGAPNPVVMLTGLRASAASAAIATNVAALAAKEMRTLLIDCSMRPHGIHTALAIPGAPGLSDVMIGTAKLDTLLHEVRPNLYVLPAGTPTSYGMKLIHQPLFVEALGEFVKSFRMVVLYHPGLREEQMASVLTGYVGTIAVIVSPGEKRERLQRFIARLKTLPNVKGLILDDLR